MTRIAIDDQARAAETALAVCEGALQAATEAHDGRAIADLTFQRDCLAAAVTTLRWLSRGREGCIQLLTTKVG